MKRGIFIVFEGPDGAGTTYHSEALSNRLRKLGRDVILTREPTEGEFGKKVRNVLTEGTYESPADLQRLFCDDRAEHVERVIEPAIRAGKIIVCDRYVPSTLIYGEASGVPLLSLMRWNEGFPKPDYLFVLLPPPEVALERLLQRASNDPFEKDHFQRCVYAGYERYVREHFGVTVIDTSGTKEEAEERVWEKVKELF